MWVQVFKDSPQINEYWLWIHPSLGRMSNVFSLHRIVCNLHQTPFVATLVSKGRLNHRDQLVALLRNRGAVQARRKSKVFEFDVKATVSAGCQCENVVEELDGLRLFGTRRAIIIQSASRSF